MEENKIGYLNKRLMMIVGAIIAIVVIGIGGATYALQSQPTFKKATGSAEDVVMTALNNTNKKLYTEQEEVGQKLGRAYTQRIVAGEAHEASFNMSLQGVSGIEEAERYSAYINGLGIGTTFQSTQDNSLGYGALSIHQGNLELLGASFYKEEDEVSVRIPRLLQDTYAIKLDTFLTDYESSELYQLMGGESIDQEALNEVTETFSALREYMAGAMSLKTNKSFLEQSQSLQLKLIQEAGLVQGENRELTVAEKTKVCRSYTGTLSSSQVITFIKGEIELLLSLDFAKNYMELVLSQAGMTVEALMEELDWIDEIYGETTLEIEFIVDDTYLLGIHMTLIDDYYAEEVGMINIEYTGGDYLSDAIEFSMALKEDDLSMGIDLSLVQNMGKKSEAYTQSMTVLIREEEALVSTINYSYMYDTKAETDNMAVSFDISLDESVHFGWSGTGTKIISASEVSMILPQMTLYMESVYGGAVEMNAALSYGLKVLKKGEIKSTEGQVKYLLEMSESELESAALSLQSNMQQFVYALALGSGIS